MTSLSCATISPLTLCFEVFAVTAYAWIKVFTLFNSLHFILRTLYPKPKASLPSEDRVITPSYIALLATDAFLRILHVLTDISLCLKDERFPHASNDAESLLGLWHVLEVKRLSLDRLSALSFALLCAWRMKQALSSLVTRRYLPTVSLYDVTETSCVAAACLVQLWKERETRDEILWTLSSRATASPWEEASVMAHVHQLIFLHFVQLCISLLGFGVTLRDSDRHSWVRLTQDKGCGVDLPRLEAKKNAQPPSSPSSKLAMVSPMTQRVWKRASAVEIRRHSSIPSVGLVDTLPVLTALSVCLGLRVR